MRSDPGEVAASTASEMRRDNLPSNARRRPSQTMHFGAQSRGLRAPCERFAPWVTPGPRITRFRLAADLGRMGLDTHRVSNKVSKITSRHLVPLDRAFPAHALVHDSKLTVNDPNPEASHRPILYDSGRPSSVIWFRTLHATTDSATRPPRDRVRSRSPRIDLYRKHAFSTPRLEMVAGLLLPAAPAERPHVRDRAISRARPRPTPRHPRGLGRWNHDSRVTHPRRFVERDRIVGRVSGHPCDLIVDRLHEVDANGRIIHPSARSARARRSRPLDQQQGAASSSLGGRVHRVSPAAPFAFAHNRQSRAVDDEMDGSSRWDAAAFNRERLTSSGERGGVGGCEIDTHQRQDRPQEAFRLAQGPPEDKAARHRRLESHSPRTSSARLVDRTATGATRPWRRQRATASRPLAGPRPARTLTNSPRDTSSCTADGPLISFRDRAPAAVTVAREPTAASSQPKGCATTRVPRKARSRGTRCRDVIFETLFETLWVSNPIRPRSAASRNRVMRGPGVTQGAKRSQGARRPRD